jgi:hypothetical protein
VQVAARRMKPSSYYERLVDVMEELYKFTLMIAIDPNTWPTAIASGGRRPHGSENIEAAVYNK